MGELQPLVTNFCHRSLKKAPQNGGPISLFGGRISVGVATTATPLNPKSDLLCRVSKYSQSNCSFPFFIHPSSDGTYYGMWCPSIRVSVRPSQFSALFSYMLWRIEMNFVLMYIRSISSIVNVCQFFFELCPFSNLEYWKYTVFRTFPLHAVTY